MYFCSNSLCGKEIFCGVGWGPESLSYYRTRSKKKKLTSCNIEGITPKRIPPYTHNVCLSVIQITNSSRAAQIVVEFRKYKLFDK
jgi:hypothetical protein